MHLLRMKPTPSLSGEFIYFNTYIAICTWLLYFTSRGDNSRTSLQWIGELHGILPKEVNITALTATATISLHYFVAQVTGLQSLLFQPFFF